MALVNAKEIQEARNNEKNGFIQLEEMGIQESDRLEKTSASNEHMAQNPKSIARPSAHMDAWKKNVRSQDADIRKASKISLKTLYILWGEAAYRGSKVEFVIHRYDSKNPLDRQCILNAEQMEGWKEAPEQLLEMYIDGRVCGVFDPDWKCFVPAAGFRDKEIHGMNPDAYLDTRPHVKERCRALVQKMIENGACDNVLGELLEDFGGALSDEQMTVYEAEKREEIPEEAAEYIRKTTFGADAAIICGYPGTNREDKLLDEPVFIYTGTNVTMGSYMRNVNSRMVIIPMVKNTDELTRIDYKWSALNEKEVPEWIEVTAVADGVLQHRIYTKGSRGWKCCLPHNYIDLAYKVPDGILSKYNYLVQGFEAAFKDTGDIDEVAALWKEFPEDAREQIVGLESRQYGGKWEVHQRTSRITRLELRDKEGNLLGCIFPEKVPAFHRKDNTVYVSFDPAGAVSVRLMTVAGSGKSKGVAFTDMIHPLTPMSGKELNWAVERHTGPANGSGTHFDSLLQLFSTEDSGGWSRLMVESRIWKPDQEALFGELAKCSGTMTAAMTEIGVVSNPKEMAARSNLTKVQQANCVSALKLYIGSALLEAALALSREGYAVCSNNLEFVVSYPENGSGEGITKFMKEAIEGALEFMNEYLTEDNQLKPGQNVSLYSESEATAEWHKNNPPANKYMGDTVAAATPDYGHSTHDYSLRVNGHLYMFSIPYAAQNITNATLAKVYKGKAAELMRCFAGGNQDLMQGAMQTISGAMELKKGKLYERLGFVLPLNRLFGSSRFCVTGANADYFQKIVQQIVEAKLNVAIPAYADSIVRAVKTGDLQSTSHVLLAPVGKGSLAMNNTADGFEKRFIARLKAQIKRNLGEEYVGNIELLPNNDVDKLSVAQGLLDLKEADNAGKKPEFVSRPDPTEYYVDIVYGEDEDGKNEFWTKLEAVNTDATRAQFRKMKEQIYDAAFDAIMKAYTYEMFEDSYNCWGYIGIGDGSFDDMIREQANQEFESLRAELMMTKKSLIMACPGLENELLCGAMLDLIIERYEGEE